ncbi:hypothetical protein AHAS_Ahas13G0241500 [Arachis hypogaea]
MQLNTLILLATVRDSVLIISTDPTHKLSGTFQQRFTKIPNLVNSFTNFYVMEVNPTIKHEDLGTSKGINGMSY